MLPLPAHASAGDPAEFPITPVVGLVRAAGAHPNAEAVVRRVLADAGVKRVRTATTDPGTPVTVWLGAADDTAATGAARRDVLDRLGAPGSQGLAPEGFALTAGRDADDRKHIVLDGVDADGAYYAALELKDLVRRHQGNDRMPEVRLRQAPAMRYRGSIEGFYGTPWWHQDRLDHLDYLGAHRMNTYEYAPKDDPYHRDRWREPYPADKLAQLGELITRAAAGHVDFTFAVSPGLSICYTDPGDTAKLLAKFDAIHALGGRSFNVALDDIDAGRWNCDGDRARYGAPGGAAAGRAQSDLLNAVQAWVRAKGDVKPLQMVPTEYYNATETGYKKALREVLDRDVILHWTGLGVVPQRITKADAARARQVFGHEILVWDNYPVNDYIAGRLPLGAYTGREPGLSEHLVGIISNPMNQAAVSKVALFSFAEFGWADTTYDAQRSWLRALDERAGGDPAVARALRDFAELNTYDGTLHRDRAPVPAAEIAAFWTAWRAGRDTTLRAYAERLRAAPGVIRAGVPDRAFAAEAEAWLKATELWSQALIEALDVLDAVRAGDGGRALAARREATGLIAAAKALRDVRLPHSGTYPRIADGVLDTFIADALTELDRWIGITADRPAATTTLGTYQDHTPDRMVDGDPGTYFWSNGSPGAGDSVTVDLGGVRAIGEVAVLMGKPGSPNDYLRAGVLEHSADGATWTTLATGAAAEVRATAPAGTRARYLRYRATGSNDHWLVVREFTAAVLDDTVTRITVGGTPAGSRPAAAADGSLDTAWQAAAAPASGNALQFTLSRPRPIDRVAVVGSGQAEVQVRVSGQWRPIGRLDGGYTELDPADVTADAIRLAWTPGGPAPAISEVVPRYADVPAVTLAADPAVLETTIGQEATLTLSLSTRRAAAVPGTLSVTGPQGWQVPADRALTVPRGGGLVLPVAFTPTGSGTLTLAFAGVETTVEVRAHRPAADVNAARGRPVTASSVEGGTSFAAAHAVDGDPATRWSSGRTDGEWLRVELAQPVDVARVVLRWEAAYGKAYRVETSDDGTTWTPIAEVTDGNGGVDDLRIDQANTARHIRVQGVRRATGYGYSLWELEVYPAR
ncbi:beta-N-acetylglucosaminidase domain-containing protein [Nonomuraea antri]|uniref:beta-N-acetylglucosaminidase domain-containing protein n=1 Tax=Nonomuraea antri TaxID=2730852 RepID=UPI001C2C15EF|nr:beta-N-acetylglucosaminidase domain-containing protein [Nonomuraea antri]